DDLAHMIRARVTPTSTVAELNGVLSCILQNPLASQPLSLLYSDTLAALDKLDDKASFAAVRQTPGFKDQLCGSPQPHAQCWQNERGIISYRTAGGLLIDVNCIVHQADGRGDWSHFPSDPATYVKMADAATVAGPSCLNRLNSRAADEFKRWLKGPPLTRVT